VTLLIDPPNAPGHGRMWSHLASDTSYDELHAFARILGAPEQGFDGDHYDIPAEWHERVIALGAVPVTSRELIERLTRSGLRVRKSTRMRPRKPGGVLLRPPLIRPGDAVAMVAPSGPPDAAKLATGIQVLEGWGLSTVPLAPQAAGEFPWLAGTDDERAANFTRAWMSPEVSVVWCARGGFGSQRILDLLDWRLLASARPKWLVGFSDITSLHQAVASRLGVVTAHGPGVTGLGDPESAESIRRLLMTGKPLELPGRSVVAGSAVGALVGGNLTVLASSVGTTSTHSAAGSIAVLEDVGERPYRLDRALTQLIRSGWLAEVRGIVCGQFTDSGDPAVLEELLVARLGTLGVPLLIDLQLGHAQPNLALPLGALATLDGVSGRLLVDG
jgi:muramoyltetrapeptide carboxypeptidase